MLQLITKETTGFEKMAVYSQIYAFDLYLICATFMDPVSVIV